MCDPVPPRDLLVGFDAQDRTSAAVMVALEMRRRFGCELEVLCAHELEEVAPGRAHSQAAEVLRAAVAESAAEAIRARFDCLVADTEGDARSLLNTCHAPAAEALLTRAAERGTDLIVLGPHEQRGHFDFGGTTRAVLGHAPCDVWVQPGEWSSPESILVPTDLTPHSRLAIDRARALAQGFDARVILLHVHRPPTWSYSDEALEAGAATDADLVELDRQADREAFDSFLMETDWGSVSHEGRWMDGEPVESILAQDADLVVIGTHGRTGLSRVLLGNVAYAVLSKAEVPVMAVRMPSRRWRI